MSKTKTMQCPTCGAEIATSAKTCPKCGAKIKKPIYKRPWFIVLVVLILLGAVGSMGGKGSSAGKTTSTGTAAPPAQSTAAATAEPEITYEACDVTTLMEALNGNALKAADTYKDKYVELTGRLANIDSSGKYISLEPTDDPYAFIGVQCYIKTEEQKKAVMEWSIGDTVTVKGKITDVGEVMGYSLNIDSIG